MCGGVITAVVISAKKVGFGYGEIQRQGDRGYFSLGVTGRQRVFDSKIYSVLPNVARRILYVRHLSNKQRPVVRENWVSFEVYLGGWGGGRVGWLACRALGEPEIQVRVMCHVFLLRFVE